MASGDVSLKTSFAVRLHPQCRALREPLPSFSFVSAAADQDRPETARRLDWRSAQGWAAFMRLPAVSEASDDHEVHLVLSGLPTEATAVDYLGLSRPLTPGSPQQTVTFTMRELRQAWEYGDEELLLRGRDGQVWCFEA